MPELKTYRLFISHAWRYDEDYCHLVDMLNKAQYFDWANYSAPEHDPLVDPDKPEGKKKLAALLDAQIRPVHCVIVISGMYAARSEWIQKEIDIAVDYGKPIIGLKPRGQERTPTAVQNVAKVMVGWNTDSIVSAIREWSI